MSIRIGIFSLLVMASASAFAQVDAISENAPDSAFVIIDAINVPNGKVEVIQPMQLDRITGHAEGGKSNVNAAESKRGIGYRIQVFSDNNIRTAKANAEYRKRLIESQMPDMRGYLTYEAPYWRVRVGDFRTQAEASAALRELKASFPTFASDFRLVRERINSEQ